MEEPTKKYQEPQTLDKVMTPSPLLYDLMKKQDALAEIRALKLTYAAVLRNCIMSRHEKLRTTFKNVVSKHLDLVKILMPQFRSEVQEEEVDDDNGDDADDKKEEDEDEEEEEEKDEAKKEEEEREEGEVDDDMEEEEEEAEEDEENEDKEDEKKDEEEEDEDEEDDEDYVVEEEEEDEDDEEEEEEEEDEYMGILIDDTSEKSKGKEPMIEPRGKGLMVSRDHIGYNVLDKTALREKLKLKYKKPLPTLIESPHEQMYGDEYETSEIEDQYEIEERASKKRKLQLRWECEDDMLLSMRGDTELQVEAICALYRQERIALAENTFSISELNFQKITLLVEFVTDGNETGPCVRSPEELDEVYRGSIALCSWLVVTYANQIYDIYYNELDLLFFIFVQNL